MPRMTIQSTLLRLGLAAILFCMSQKNNLGACVTSKNHQILQKMPNREIHSPHIPKHVSIRSAKITTIFVTCLEIQCFVNAQDMACVPPERNKIVVAGNIT